MPNSKHTCPECLRTFTFPPKAAGRVVKCPACKKSVRLPKPEMKFQTEVPGVPPTTTTEVNKKTSANQTKSPFSMTALKENPLFIPVCVLSALVIALLGIVVFLALPKKDVAFAAARNEVRTPTTAEKTDRNETLELAERMESDANAKLKPTDARQAAAAEAEARQAKEKELLESRLRAARKNPPVRGLKMYQVYDEIDKYIATCFEFDGVTVWCDVEKSDKFNGFEMDVDDTRSVRHSGFSEEFLFVISKPMADSIRADQGADTGLKAKINCQILSGGENPVAEILSIGVYSVGGWIRTIYHADGNVQRNIPEPK